MRSRQVRESGWRYVRARLSLPLCLMVILHSSCLEADTASNKGDDNHKVMSPCSGANCRTDSEHQDKKCNNPDGWNLRGSEWGCCGNYDGCCTYASFVCYLHDAVCKCCDTTLCGPDCKPEPECVSTTTDNGAVLDKPGIRETNREHKKNSIKDGNDKPETEQHVAAVGHENSNIGTHNNLTANAVNDTFQYQGDQGIQSNDSRLFGTDNSEEEGSGEADEKVNL